MTSLPRGWSHAQLGEIVGVIRGRRNPQENPEMPFVGMDNVEAQSMRILDTVPAALMKSSATHFLPGDILYGRLRPYLNKVVQPDFEGLASAEFIPLTPREGVLPEFVRLRINAADFVQFASRLDEGDRPRVDWNGIRAFELLLPPTDEQGRITDSLDSLFSRLDSAAKSLETAERKLQAYRASVLKAAVEGRLVPTEAELARKEGRSYEPADVLLERILKERRRRWEEGELTKLKAAGRAPKDDDWKTRYKAPQPPNTAELPGLPEGWCWARAEQLSEFITKGTTPAHDAMAEGTGDVPYVKVYNLTFDGTLNFEQDPTFVSRNTHEGVLARSICRAGDVLMNLVGPPLGKVSLLPARFPEWNINQAIARYRLIDSALSQYFAHVLLEARALKWAMARAKTTVGQVNLTLEIARDIPIPLPPRDEQVRIVDEVERQLSDGAAVGEAAGANQQRCRQLRQAILKWSFEGRLVDQDPADEPADALLARIRAERAATPTNSSKAKRSWKPKAAS